MNDEARYRFGDIVHLVSGQPCRVLDDPNGSDILVAVILSGFGDPYRWIRREQIKEELHDADRPPRRG